MTFELQPLVERYECHYFAENDTGDDEVLNLALQSPFIRLYALSRDAAALERQKQRFQGNERIQLFQRTHNAAWLELVRLIPTDQPAVFWMHPVENIARCVTIVARLRPRREDILIFSIGPYRGVLQRVAQHFGRTHRMQRSGMHDGSQRWSPDPLTWVEHDEDAQFHVVSPRAAGRR